MAAQVAHNQPREIIARNQPDEVPTRVGQNQLEEFVAQAAEIQLGEINE